MPDLIRIDAEEIQQVLGNLDRLGRVGRNALLRAVRKTTDFAASQVGRRVASANRVPVRALTAKGRGQRIFKSRASGGRTSGYVWVGFNPLPVSRIGVPKKTRDGTRVGKHRFPGSFIATMPSGYKSSFRRGDKARVKKANNLFGITSLPIEEDAIALNEAEGAVREVGVLARARLRQLAAQELNFELNVRGR